MGTPYQESYGEHGIMPGHQWEEDTVAWRFEVRNLWYDWREHVWKCRCPVYIEQGACKHAYRYRRQVTVEVREEFL